MMATFTIIFYTGHGWLGRLTCINAKATGMRLYCQRWVSNTPALSANGLCIEEHPMMNWPDVLRDMEHWADGFLTGAAAASLIAIVGTAIVLLARAV